MVPIFMIGTQRSGSNLLRLMLNQLPEVASPHPPHILERMMPFIPNNGPLSRNIIFTQLVEDVCRLVELNPVKWQGVVLDRKQVADRCRKRNLVAIYGAVYDLYAESQGAETWCCKSLANINYVAELERYFKRPKYIYLYRDGRDVAVSFSKAVVGEKHYYHIAKEWAATQELALKLRNQIGPKRFLSVSYEHLTSEPEATAHRICDFLGVAYRPAMLEYHLTDEARRAASSSNLWGNVTNPVIKNNTRKYLSEASEQDVRIFESVAGHVLDVLGYERAYVKSGEAIAFTASQIAAFDAKNKQLKEECKKLIDPADLMRRELQANLLKEIKKHHTGELPKIAVLVKQKHLFAGARAGKDFPH